MGDQHLRRGADQRDRHEVLHRIVARLGIDGRIDAVRHVGVEQRVAVGRRPRDDLRAQHAGGARPVVDDQVVAADLLELLRHQPPGEVGAAARRIGHHEADGLRRVCRLRAGRRLRTGPPGSRRPGSCVEGKTVMAGRSSPLRAKSAAARPAVIAGRTRRGGGSRGGPCSLRPLGARSSHWYMRPQPVDAARIGRIGVIDGALLHHEGADARPVAAVGRRIDTAHARRTSRPAPAPD